MNILWVQISTCPEFHTNLTKIQKLWPLKMYLIFWLLLCTFKSLTKNDAVSGSGNGLYATMMQVYSWDTIAITVTQWTGWFRVQTLWVCGFRAHPDCPQGAPSLFYNGYCFSFLGVSSQGMALSTHPHLVPG